MYSVNLDTAGHCWLPCLSQLVSDYHLRQYNAAQCPCCLLQHVLHSLPCCGLVLVVGGPSTAAVIKPHEVSLLLLQTTGDDLVQFCSFAGLVVTLHCEHR